MRTIWIYWWWCKQGEDSAFIRTTFSSRRRPAKQIQEYDTSNGWKLGKVHRVKVAIEAPPK